MDKRQSIKVKLNPLFCDMNKEGRKYTEVWLSEVEFSFPFRIDSYVLNVRTERKLDSYGDETFYILKLLDEKAYTELQSIWRVNVLDTSEDVHCSYDEVLVYSEQEGCA